MRLSALAIGAGLPAEDFRGTVAQVYPHVVLLSLRDQLPERVRVKWESGFRPDARHYKSSERDDDSKVSHPALATLATARVGHLPRGITASAPAEFQFESAVAAGAEFAVRGGILRFAASALSVDLRGACRWRCALADLRLDIGKAPVRRAWQTVHAALARDGRSDGLQQAAAPAIEDLVAASRGFAPAAAGAAVAALIGRGAGTTPEADDFLVGFLAGLWSSMGVIDARRRLVSALCEEVRAAALQTSRVSRLYLEAAAEGEVSERLHTLAMRLAEGAEGAAVAGPVQAALAVGHSSGACGVLGLLTGSVVWSRMNAAALAAPSRAG